MIPLEFTLESLRTFFVNSGGVVKYVDLLDHFKHFLTDPTTKELARAEFKTFINTLASVEIHNEEKILILKEKFLEGPIKPPPPPPPISPYFEGKAILPDSFNSPCPPFTSPAAKSKDVLNKSTSLAAAVPFSKSAQSPNNAYSKTDYHESCVQNLGIPVLSGAEESCQEPPPVPPRKVSQRSPKIQNHDEKENFKTFDQIPEPEDPNVESNDALHVSVRERTQKFNRMVSQSELSKCNDSGKKRHMSHEKNVAIDDDAVSVTSTLDPLVKEWFLRACRGDYQAVARMLQDHPWLAKQKDIITTALHWAAKHNNTDMVKLLAGKYACDVNARSGYTPLHIAAQCNSQEALDLLVQTYDADNNARDYSGKKPHQYTTAKEIFCEVLGSLHDRRRHHEHGIGTSFLRMGSFNVRVKKTTEVINNLLAGATLGRNWSSIDNLQAMIDSRRMPPPKTMSFKRKKSKKQADQVLSVLRPPPRIKEDSDSDSACGFGQDWSYPCS